ncbi:glutaredoxin [Alkalihalobacillus alcalophilus ATCC 27647 = CGMCC 1.3604]|uniref:Glutaredoxin n=1 Tax=Alkalihalobacillus alcalophilus ATCC 27647 = CGMCC 1.3604 TaxID=1218173 RepID=A0A4S4K0P1_ALKAL|nr:glutaredoxin family protein [Alkalihalobacillus alcalophilus]MED1562967.1 glutaredoxin family protein [Alkalihalobacillus alcalophilus]THG91138.1 glutaredoxin [Alkalihalobacillus alcalophilus ATCC 27647 = CGMCC 1.3604]
MMVQVEVMSKNQCPLCVEAIAELRNLQNEIEFEIKVTDIYQDDALLEKYQLMIPVVLVGGKEVGYGHISALDVREAIKKLK